MGAASTANRKAKQAASALAFGKEVTIQTHGNDKYKRTIGDVILPDGINLNQELVKQGWCWWYRKYAPGDTVLEGLEKEAREARKGLWADPQPVPPWVYHKAKRVNDLNLSQSDPTNRYSKVGRPADLFIFLVKELPHAS